MTTTIRLGLPLMSGLALVLLAALLVAGDQPTNPNLEQLKALPQAERQRLWENLQRFDKMRRAERESARELDRRIGEIDNPAQKAHYLRVLRRYHLWFESLPEANREEILKAAPDNRMTLVSKFIAEQKSSTKVPPAVMLLQLADLGSFSPIDVAVIYKVWQTLGPEAKAELEKSPPQQFRNQISKRGTKSSIAPDDFVPSKYKEADWVEKIEKRQRLLRGDQVAKKEFVRDEIRRHLALNYYFIEHPPKAVADANLALFVSQLPELVRSTYDVFSPEEARRRISIAYRLVFPDGEIPTSKKPGQTTAAPGSATGAGGGAPPGVSSSPTAAPTAPPQPQTKPGAAKPALPF